MNRDELARRLGRACESVIAARDELTEIDSRFGDADHGITMEKIAQAVAEAVAASGGGINAHAGRCGDGGHDDKRRQRGAALEHLAGRPGRGRAEGGELDAEGLRRMLGHALESLSEISKAKVGDKTMMDALIPATEAALACEGTEGEILEAAAKAAAEGAEASRDFVSKFGRARSYGEATIGTPDAGAVSMSRFFAGLAE